MPRPSKQQSAARIWLRITYRCCGIEWSDEWPELFRFECPDCGMFVEALEVVEIGPR
jgi:hypothetical protein